MADTSVKIDEQTRDLLKTQADGKHMSMKDYLAELAQREENARRLQTATAAFQRVINEPGIADAFDAEYGGLPEAPQRAA
jgi:hypothetical protein